MSITLYNGDCLEIMKTLPDKSVDCFICDLPFGCLHPERKRDETKWYDSAGQARGSCPWDVKINLEEFWIQVKRLCKNDSTPVLMFCTTRFGYELIKKEQIEKQKEERRQMWFEKERTMKNIIDLRMMLYQMYPNDLEKISSLFQMYDLE